MSTRHAPARRIAALGAVLLLVFASVPAVRAQAPVWSVNPAAFEQSMGVIATVSVGGVRLASPGDRVAAFVGGSVRGVAAPTAVGGGSVFFLTVYGSTAGEPVTFRAYDAAANTVRDLSATLAFAANAIHGSVLDPLALAPGATTGGGGSGTPADPWTVTPSRFSRSMSIVGEVRYGSGDGAGASDVVAAFVGSEVRGVATAVEADGRRVFFLTAYANADGEALTFKVATGGAVRAIDGTRAFAGDAVVGTLVDPVAWAVAGSPAGGTDTPGAWTVDPSSFDRSMNHVAALFTGGARSSDPNDRVAAFVGGEVRGVAAPRLVGGAWYVFMTVYGRAENEIVSYKAFDATRGEVLAVSGTRAFATNAVVGTPAVPDVLAARGGWGVAEDPRTWSVSPPAFEQTMSAVAQVRVGGVPAATAGTRVAALVGGEVRGVASVSGGASPGSALFFLTVHGRPGDGAVTYKAFDAETGRVYDAAQTGPFEANRIDGQPGAPLVLDVAPDPLSVFVYPGDGNGDGRVNQNDLFPLSFYFGLTGPPRSGSSVQFRSELAAAWGVPAASTADMNGDGRINQNDLFPLGLNFGRQRGASGFLSSASAEPSSAPRLHTGVSPGTSAGGAAVLTGVPSANDVRSGDTLRVSVRLGGAGAVRGAGFQMRYDPALFEPLGRVRGTLFAGPITGGEALDLTRSESGRFSYAAALTGGGAVGAGADGSGSEVVVVRLRARAGASGRAVLTFETPAAMGETGEAIALTAAPIAVSIGSQTATAASPLAAAVTLDAPVPSPARASARLRVRIATPGPVRVTLTDVTGRTVATLFDAPLTPGADALVDIDTSALASGLYLVRAQTPHGVATRTLVVRH